jgi:predicted TIM-barrel enzyme
MIAEIEGYHFTWMNSEMPIEAKARMAMTVGADAVEILHADEEINNKMVHDIKAFNPNIPVVLGGKTDLENCTRRMKEADAVLVGSCFEDGKWGGNIDANIVKEYVKKIRSLEK